MNPTSDPFKSLAPWLAALFITALGAHLWVAWLYGSSIPLWDQWYEAAFFKSWMAGTWRVADFFAPNNEHRVFLTRVLDIVLIEMNGRWEPLLQMAVNAFIYAAFACCFAYCVWEFFGRKNGWLICSLLIPFFVLPYGGENTIWAFNSQNYFVNICALAAIAGLGFGKAGAWRWYCGCVAVVLGLFTTAGGLFAPVAIGGLTVLRAIKSRRFGKGNLTTLAVCVLVTVLGLAVAATKPEDKVFQAHSLLDFTSALTRNLSWPFYNAPLMPVVIVFPLALLLAFYLRPNFGAARPAEFLLALALWSLLQSVAIAFGRANYGGNVPSSRYMDLFNVLVIAAVFAALLLAQSAERHRFRNGALSFLFFAIILYGLCNISNIVVENLLVRTRMINLICEERIQRLAATGSATDFLENPTVPPDPKLVMSVLQDDQLQTILPLACVAPSATTPEYLMPAARFVLRHCIFILWSGLVLFAALCLRDIVPAAPGHPARNPAALLPLLAVLVALAFVFTKRNVSRESVEYQLQEQIAASFHAAGNSVRAAIHEQKAEALKQFAN